MHKNKAELLSSTNNSDFRVKHGRLKILRNRRTTSHSFPCEVKFKCDSKQFSLFKESARNQKRNGEIGIAAYTVSGRT